MASEEKSYPPAVISAREGPELGQTSRPQVIAKALDTDYPLIDSDPHFTRVCRYARRSDYVAGLGLASITPFGMLLFERTDPSGVSRKAFQSVLRLSISMGITGGFLFFYQRSIFRFYGFTENRREIEMDMREMTDRVKQRLPLYGRSKMSEYMQGVASRNSRYTGVMLNIIPWFNFVNHPHHGVDTAKYYQQAERELEAEQTGASQ